VYVIVVNWTRGGNGIATRLEGPFQITPLLLAIGSGLLALVLTSVRWYILVRAQDLPLSLWNALRFGALGYFLGTILPGSIGGDLGRAILITRGQERRASAVSTVVVDGVIALWTLLFLVVMVGLISGVAGDPELQERTSLRFFVLLALGGVVGGWLCYVILGLLQAHHTDWVTAHLARFPAVQHAVADLFTAVRLYRNRAGMIALAILVSLGAQSSSILSFYLAAQVFPASEGMGIIPTMAQHFVIVPIAMLIQFGFPAPGGVGAGEYAYGKLYSLALGNPDATATGVLAALVSRTIAFGLGIVGYVMYLVTGSRRTEAAQDGSDEGEPSLPSAA
jgi:uncharacterized protein (TIRG00374 family)